MVKDEVPTAPAAHLVTVEGTGGGQLVGHLLCNAPPVFVPNMPDARYALAIDIIQATLNHRCPADSVGAGGVPA